MGAQMHMPLAPRFGLTPRARDCLGAIAAHIERTGSAPSYNDLAEALGLRSKSGVVRLIAELQERGWIRKLPYRPRSIEVVGWSDGTQPFRIWPLSAAVNDALHAHCHRTGESPADVVSDAVALFLDQAEAT